MVRRRYVSEELVHWTGRSKADADAFKVLSLIVDERILRLTYCPNYVNPAYKPEAAMVCFTDIPLNHSREHCSKFGRFGIAFKKSKMIEYGANPVFYTTGQHFERVKHIATLLDRMSDLEKDREWKKPIAPYQFTENETVAMRETIEFLQEYSYKNQDQSDYVHYYQREWRLTFKSLPLAGQGKSHEPGMATFDTRNGANYPIFKFATSDVEYIVVPLGYWFKGRRLAKKIGCSLKLYQCSVGD